MWTYYYQKILDALETLHIKKPKKSKTIYDELRGNSLACVIAGKPVQPFLTGLETTGYVKKIEGKGYVLTEKGLYWREELRFQLEEDLSVKKESKLEIASQNI